MTLSLIVLLKKTKIRKSFWQWFTTKILKKKEHLLRLLLLDAKYKAQLWDQKAAKFVDAEYDIFQQKHFNKEGGAFDDNVMYIKANIEVDQVALVKLIKTDVANNAGESPDKATNKDISLTL